MMQILMFRRCTLIRTRLESPGRRAGNRIKRRAENTQIVVSQGVEPQDLGAVKKVENS